MVLVKLAPLLDVRPPPPVSETLRAFPEYSGLWLATDDVLICSKSVVYKGKQLKLYTIINKDESGEEVGAERLK